MKFRPGTEEKLSGKTTQPDTFLETGQAKVTMLWKRNGHQN